MSGITRNQRAQGWNVRFLVHGDAVAGLYQRDGFLSIGDVARDLDLCLVFNLPGHGRGDSQDASRDWHPALLPTPAAPEVPVAAAAGRMIVLKEDTDPFPTPPAGEEKQYNYVFHSQSLCHSSIITSHTITDACIRQAAKPCRRHNPAYLEIGAWSDNPLIAPTRSTRSLKRKNSMVSTSPSPSQSSIQTPSSAEVAGTDNLSRQFPRAIIQQPTAQAVINEFRRSVLSSRYVCAISGKGASWLQAGAGPAVEAAHIVPQCHWHVYPVHDEQRVAHLGNKTALQEAWTRTWSAENGLALLSHLHKCFDARLISIHPKTHRIRSFVDYDVLTDFHGQPAYLPKHVDKRALQHHWDMCCIENMIALWVPDLITSLDDPGKGIKAAPPSPPSVDRPQHTNTPIAEHSEDLGHGSEQHGQNPQPQQAPRKDAQPLCTTRPASPPSSDTARRSRKQWWLGEIIIDDPDEARRLTSQGWILYPASSDEEEDAEEEYRGRSLKRRQYAVDEWLDKQSLDTEAQTDDIHVPKRRRHAKIKPQCQLSAD